MINHTDSEVWGLTEWSAEHEATSKAPWSEGLAAALVESALDDWLEGSTHTFRGVSRTGKPWRVDLVDVPSYRIPVPRCCRCPEPSVVHFVAVRPGVLALQHLTLGACAEHASCSRFVAMLGLYPAAVVWFDGAVQS